MSRFWFKARKLLAHKVLHTDDTPHAIALGAGIAMLVAFLPIVGLQTIIAISLAALLRANKAICLPIVWITNPLTVVPIYGACFGLGHLVLHKSEAPDQATILSQLQPQQAAGFFELTFWKGLLSRLTGFGGELWLGCIIVGTALAIAAYLIARWGVSGYRERRRLRILQRSLHRARLQARKITRRSEPA